MLMHPIRPHPQFWNINLVELLRDRIVVHAEPLRRAVPCPECGTASSRVHSRYTRRPRDLPWSEWPVQLVVHSRKLFCDDQECPQRIFVERFPGVLERYAHQTERFHVALLELSYVASAEAASRVAKTLGYPASPDTLIRRQRREQFIASTPRVLGIDEFSMKRGRRFHTLMVDLERHCPVDMVEDRTADPVIRWLQEHPGVQIISRDRAESYAQAGRTGAPDAIQVADRFHLVRNVYDSLKKLVRSSRWDMTEPDMGLVEPPTRRSPLPSDIDSTGMKQTCPPMMKQSLWEAIRYCKDNGMGIRAIARELGVHRGTVRKYMAMDGPPAYTRHAPRRTKLTPFLPYLRERWSSGCHNARHLYDELRVRGYSGKYTQVKDTVRPWRTTEAASPPPRRIELWSLLLPSHDKLDGAQQRELDRILAANALLETGYGLKERFLRLVRERSGLGLDQWLVDAENSEVNEFVALSKSFRNDYDAIKAGLTLRWSTAQCEGQITRVKLIKRLGYGRAKPDLLRKRVLHRTAA